VRPRFREQELKGKVDCELSVTSAVLLIFLQWFF